MRIGTWELILILAIVLMIFGVGRLPQVGKALGSALREFRRGQQEEADKEKARPATEKKSDQEEK